MVESVKGIAIAGVIILAIVIASNTAVSVKAKGGVVTLEDLQMSEVVMVLGASVHPDGQPSSILEDRLLTAIDIYKAGKAKKFLLSGDNGQQDYDEVNVMKAYLLHEGIPAGDIFLDHAGFDSYDSLYRARDIFGLKSFTIVTQAFHLPRTIYLGRSLGLDVHGVAADRHEYVKIDIFKAREWLANVKAVFDVLFKSKPTYLGDPISIEGDGQVTWD
jgi:SanA protein